MKAVQASLVVGLCLCPSAQAFLSVAAPVRAGRQQLSSATMTLAVAEPRAKPLSERRLAKIKAREERAARVRDAKIIDTTNAPVTRISSQEEYVNALAQHNDSLTVVKFFAPWCRSCKAMDAKYRKLAIENKDVKFYEVDTAEAPYLKQALGVKSVPTVKMYAGAVGQVASFTCGPRKVVELERKMNLCKDVPALTARVSKVTGLMEMVAQMEDGDTVSTPSRSISELDTVVPPVRTPERVGLITGLMEKLARQEKLARALAEAQLSEFPLCAAAL